MASADDKCPPKNYLSMKRTGRRPVFLEGPTIEQMVEDYRRTGSLRKTAINLGVAVNTIRKYMNWTQEEMRLGRKAKDTWDAEWLKPFDDWVKSYAQVLPRDMKKISELSGFSLDQIKTYLRRRRSAMLDYIRSFGDIRDIRDALRTHLVDIKGRSIPVGMISQYMLDIDRYSLVVTITGVLRFGGRVSFKLSMEKYCELFKAK